MRRLDLTSPMDQNEVYRLARALDALWVVPRLLPIDGKLSPHGVRAIIRLWRGAEMWKPRPLEPFQIALQQIGVQPDVAVYEPTADQMAGVKSFWSRRVVKRGKSYHTVVEVADMFGEVQLVVVLARRRKITKWLLEN